LPHEKLERCMAIKEMPSPLALGAQPNRRSGLKGLVMDAGRRCELLEEQYARETLELQTHASNLKIQINKLQKL
jgi:hypothetical protein